MPSSESWDPHVRRAVGIIQSKFPVKGSTYVGHQPRMGLAADFMCSKAVGDKLAVWARQNASSLGIEYIIWWRRIWNIRRDSEGWRHYTGTPNPHTDHVHVSWLPAAQAGKLGPNQGTDSEFDDDPSIGLDASGQTSDSTLVSFLQALSDPHTHKRILFVLVGIILMIVGTARLAKVTGTVKNVAGKVLS